MFGGDLILVMLEVALLAEVCLFSEAEVGGDDVLTVLAKYFLTQNNLT